MAYTQLLFENLGRVGRITLNRPRYRNAQSTVLLKELDRAFEEAATDDEGEGESVVCRESGVIGMSEWVVIPGNSMRFTRNLMHLWG